MALVTDMQNQLKATVATVLGADWKELTQVYQVEKNTDRVRFRGYGVRPLGSRVEDGVTRFYTMAQTMEVILTRTIPSDVNDSQRETAINELFDKVDGIFKNVLGGKLSSPEFILVINNPDVSEPEIFETESFVALRLRMDIVYRSGALT